MMGSSRRQVEGTTNSYISVLEILLGKRMLGHQRDGFSIRTVDWTKDCFQWRILVMSG